MTDLDELYQDIIIEHYAKPRNFRKLEDANHTMEGYNPLCGDRITLYLKVDGGVVTAVGFQGSGCAISRASASMMTQSVKGRSRAEVRELFDAFHKMITRAPGTDFDPEKLEDLGVLSGVVDFPVRVKCASLSWHTLRAALEGSEEPVTTE